MPVIGSTFKPVRLGLDTLDDFILPDAGSVAEAAPATDSVAAQPIAFEAAQSDLAFVQTPISDTPVAIDTVDGLYGLTSPGRSGTLFSVSHGAQTAARAAITSDAINGVPITGSGIAYTQDFDTLSNTAGSTTNNLVIANWFMTEDGGGARDNEQYAVDTGASTTGDTYSYGSAGSTDRALGSLRSGTLISTFGAEFTNTTGSTITELLIAFTGEQWRIGTLGRADRLDFQISFDATSLTVGTWVDVNALDFISPTTTGSTGAKDGNAAGFFTNLSSTITSLNIANGASFWIRWVDADASGADDGLAIDNFSLTATAGPALPVLTINDVTQAEGNAGTTAFTFTVSLSAPAGAGGVTFDIRATDNTAIEPSDYLAFALTGQTIPAGASTATFTIQVNGDTTFEPDETFFVNVTNVTGATVGDGQGLGTITNDDLSPTPFISIDDVTVTEGNSGTTTATFTVSLNQPAGAGGVTFDIATADGTASSLSDYVAKALSGQTIPEGASTYSFTVDVTGDTAFESNESFFVNLTNVVGATVTDGQGQGTITNDDFTPIYEIQGAGHFSAYNGQAVTTQGVVTGVVTTGSARGYYIQDVTGDGNANTSDAVFVFTGAVTPTVTVGQLLSVSGTVTEFRASGALSLTEITAATATVLGTAALPDAVIIGEGAGMRTPPKVQIGDNDITGVFDPATQGSDFYETMEGMRVTVADAISTSAFKNSNGEIWVRSGTITTDSLNDRGGLTISDTTPGVLDPASRVFDFNPERIKLNDTLSPLPTISAVGDKLGDVTGILSYNFGSYEVLNTAPVTVTQASTLQKEVTTIEASLDTVRVASFNVRNLSPVGTQDGEGSDGSTAAEMAARAQAIVTNLKSPDIIALQELQDNNGTTNDSTTDASLTLQQLIDAIVAAGGPRYKAIDSNPADDQDGGVPGGNIRVAYLYNPEVVNPSAANGLVQDSQPDVFEYNPANRIGVGDADFASTRKSLPIEWLPAGYTETQGGSFYVINNHFSSKGGSATLVGGDMGNPQYGEPVNSDAVKREGQAIEMKAFIDSILADGNANNDRFVALGDFNDFQFFPVMDLATGRLVRTSAGSGNTDSTFAAGAQILQNLSQMLAASERYSYNFDGNAQALDHMLVSNNLYATTIFDIVHINSEFADQISDHDPAVAALLMPRSAALATPGADTLDQAAFTARFGATRGSLAGNDQISGLAGDDVISAGDGDDILNGDEGNDILMGGAGADTLDGGTGMDAMSGGTGDDTYVVDNAGDTVTEAPGEGEDTVLTALASYTLTANVENLIGTSTTGQILIGNAEDNQIVGFSGDDVLVGGAGADALTGGDGIDFVDYGVATAGVTIDLLVGLGVGAEADGDTYVGVENVTGGAFNDSIRGDSLGNRLFGGLGDDVIDGGLGDDFLIGGGGADSLTGGDGNDTIEFGAEDTLVSGGAGFDTGVVTSGMRTVINLETASLEYVIDTAGGDDWFQGTFRTEAVTIFAGAGTDVVQGGSGDDVLWGEAGADTIVGGAGNDVLVGGSGADLMNGGLGRDILYGGLADGAQDLFRFTNSGAANWDYVREFEVGTDKIDLRALSSSFGDVTINVVGANSEVFVSGQQVATVIGVTTLTSGDFLFGAPPSPADPGDVFKGDTALVQPIVFDDWTDQPLVRPSTGEFDETAVVCAVEPEKLVADIDWFEAAGGHRLSWVNGIATLSNADWAY